MSEIKVVPYIPDEDYDNPAMVVDFYEFTMANCLFLNGFKNTTLVFDMFFRKNPDNQGYSISAGQRKLTRFLLNYHFNEQDVHWLRTKGMSEEFCEYLRTYKWKGDMYALPEGTVCYPHVQMVRIECDLVGAILIETYLLQTMNFHSLIATKAVSYTHLQNEGLLGAACGHIGTAHVFPGKEVLGHGACSGAGVAEEAVSYTHLDVYKRQAQATAATTASCPSFRSS